MEVKTDAIVLRSIDYKDNDKLLTLFSPTLGKITAGARGVKKPKAKLSFAAQPFCFAEYVLAEKGGRYTVTSAYMHESFYSLRTDVTRFYAACAAAEVCNHILLENDALEGTFIAFIGFLKSVALSEDDPAEALATFLLVALHESGYPIDLGYLEETDGDIGDKLFFDFSDGRFDDERRLEQGERASVCTYFVLRKCAGLDFDEDRLSGGRKRALRLLKAYLSLKTELAFENLGEFIRLYEEP
ncbi:MAG: DNA repair protein RecO [Clostridia bacterium]|nr:DNA repair protein RecO [Clostridia bacterium]